MTTLVVEVLGGNWDVDDGGSCNNCAIGNSLCLGEDEVALSSDAFRYLDGSGRSLDGDELCADGSDEGGVFGTNILLSLEIDSVTDLKGAGVADSDSGERLEWKGWVAGWAALDEWSSKGVDLVEV